MITDIVARASFEGRELTALELSLLAELGCDPSPNDPTYPSQTRATTRQLEALCTLADAEQRHFSSEEQA